MFEPRLGKFSLYVRLFIKLILYRVSRAEGVTRASFLADSAQRSGLNAHTTRPQARRHVYALHCSTSIQLGRLEVPHSLVPDRSPPITNGDRLQYEQEYASRVAKHFCDSIWYERAPGL